MGPYTLTEEQRHETGVDFYLEPGGSISGSVYYADGTPIEYITVEVVELGSFTCTDGAGNYTLTGLPVGSTYTVIAGSPEMCDTYVGVTATTWVDVLEGSPHVEGIDFTLGAYP